MRVSRVATDVVRVAHASVSQDKQLVEAYKADIKRQLTAAGLIRGQPRTPSLMQTVPSTPTVASQGSYGFPDAPGPSTQATTRPSPSTLDFRYAPQPNQTMQPGEYFARVAITGLTRN